MKEESLRNDGLCPEQNKLFDLTTMTKVRILNSQTIDFSDIESVIGFRSGKKLKFLRNLLRNYENLSRTFTKSQSLLGTMGHTYLVT